MEIPEIKTKLRELLREHFGPATEQGMQDTDRLWKKPSELTLGHIDPQDGLDSLDKVEFAMAVEKEFNLEISDALLKHANSLDDFAKLLQTMLPGPSANGG